MTWNILFNSQKFPFILRVAFFLFQNYNFIVQNYLCILWKCLFSFKSTLSFSRKASLFHNNPLFFFWNRPLVFEKFLSFYLLCTCFSNNVFICSLLYLPVLLRAAQRISISLVFVLFPLGIFYGTTYAVFLIIS